MPSFQVFSEAEALGSTTLTLAGDTADITNVHVSAARLARDPTNGNHYLVLAVNFNLNWPDDPLPDRTDAAIMDINE